MGHKPDQKARRKRREREAKKAAKPNKPPATLRELFDKKREGIAKNRRDFREELSKASPGGRAAYARCHRAIRRAHKKPEVMAICLGMPSAEVMREAAVLLRHPRNGYPASELADATPDGSHQQYSISIQLHDPHED